MVKGQRRRLPLFSYTKIFRSRRIGRVSKIYFTKRIQRIGIMVIFTYNLKTKDYDKSRKMGRARE
jgi:hypothetical protein